MRGRRRLRRRFNFGRELVPHNPPCLRLFRKIVRQIHSPSAAAVGGIEAIGETQSQDLEPGPGTYCSPRHRMPFISRDEG
jgi:hypothetical protein